MKKIITIAILLFSMATYAQGNLQFNQVLNIKNGDTYTVPAGKVLKITSTTSGNNFTFMLPFTNCFYQPGPYLYCAYASNTFEIASIAGLKYNLTNLNNSVMAPQGQCHQCPATLASPVSGAFGVTVPIWLKAGEIVSITQGSGILISAIEFNIVQ
jgi:hypothetical protein